MLVSGGDPRSPAGSSAGTLFYWPSYTRHVNDEFVDRVVGVDRIVEQLRTFLDASDQAVVLSFPYARVDRIREHLAAALERGAVVLLLLYGTPERGIDADRAAGLGTVVRTSHQQLPLVASMDFERGVLAQRKFHADGSRNEATVFTEWLVSHAIYGEFMGNYWSRSTEQYATDPSPLPLACEWFPQAVIEATLRLRDGRRVAATIDGRPVDGRGDHQRLRGEVVDTRQGFVDPGVCSFDNQSTLVVRSDDRGLVTVGGLDAYLEAFEAATVTLQRVE